MPVMRRLMFVLLPIACLAATVGAGAGAAASPNPRLDALKQELIADIDARRRFTQQMVDSIFSFSELGFQEVETQRYVTDILEKEGFDRPARRRRHADVVGRPLRESGRPVIALGTDIDGLPTTNQTPGVVTRKELVPGAPGHGEGHNAGQAIDRHRGARR